MRGPGVLLKMLDYYIGEAKKARAQVDDAIERGDKDAAGRSACTALACELKAAEIAARIRG